MRRRILLCLLLLAPLCAPLGAAETTNPLVRLQTSLGAVTIELLPEQAPRSVQNFLGYVEQGFYEGLVFHRVIEDFMVQTGGFDAELTYRDPTLGRVRNESVGGPLNLRGTVAMARQRNPDSADSQFFINVGDNPHLNADGQRPGYTVFGRVVEGMDVVDRISLVRTGRREGMYDVPLESIVIEAVTRLDGTGKSTGS